jgi:hypothetical protein
MTLPAPGTPLIPGRYTAQVLGLTVGFGIDEDWVREQDATDFFDVERDPASPDVIAVQFAGVSRPWADVAEEIRGMGDLTFDPPGAGTFVLNCELGLPRLTVSPSDVDPDSPQFWPVLDTNAGTLSVASGRRLQIDFVALGDKTVLIMVGGSIAHWDDTQFAAGPVLSSLVLSKATHPACD